jgi:hypothetical protein
LRNTRCGDMLGAIEVGASDWNPNTPQIYEPQLVRTSSLRFGGVRVPPDRWGFVFMASRLCIIPARALQDEAMTPTELRVLCAIGRFTSEDGTGVWAAAQTLADVANVHVAHLRRAVNALVERGYVARQYRYRADGAQDTNMLSILLDHPLSEIRPPLAEPATPTPAESAYPPYAESAKGTYAESAYQTTYLNDPSERPHYSLGTKVSKRESMTGQHLSTMSTPAEPPLFHTVWQDYPKRAGSNSRQAALKAYRSRVREGVSEQALLDGVRRYARFVQATGRERTEYVKQAASFFGPNRHWEEPWDVPASRGELRATATTTLLQDWVNNGN